jgi:hypothetical protein
LQPTTDYVNFYKLYRILLSNVTTQEKINDKYINFFNGRLMTPRENIQEQKMYQHVSQIKQFSALYLD